MRNLTEVLQEKTQQMRRLQSELDILNAAAVLLDAESAGQVDIQTMINPQAILTGTDATVKRWP